MLDMVVVKENTSLFLMENLKNMTNTKKIITSIPSPRIINKFFGKFLLSVFCPVHLLKKTARVKYSAGEANPAGAEAWPASGATSLIIKKLTCV